VGCGAVTRAIDGLCPVCLVAPWRGHGDDDLDEETSILDHAPGYDLLELLGRGGMGVVYRARQHNSPREVALKKLRGGEQATPEERRRFVTEIEAAARVRHPNIVEIYDVGGSDESPYFTMPLFPTTLRAKLEHYQSPRAAAALIAKIARAVRHAHKRGVLHRDLKPDNILIDERGEPHVADFGLAKQIGDATLTAAGIGTPEYAAPEQLRNDRDAITTAIDQYSLGVMLYELLTGKRPFRSTGDVVALLRAICETEPPSPRTHVPDLPLDLEAICLRSIARMPQDRYDTVGELADDLDRFLRGEPTMARPPGVVARGRRFLWHHRLTVGLGGSALVLLAVIASSALTLAHEQESQLSRSTRDGYMHTAQAIASLVTQHLRRQEDQVVALARRLDREVALAKLLDQEDLPGLGDVSSDKLLPRLLKILTPYLRNGDPDNKDGFDDIWLFDPSGKLVVQLPSPDGAHADVRGKDYAWRDYFKGAKDIFDKHGSGGYVAKPLEAEITCTYKYGISVPISDGNRLEGVLMAAKDTTKDSREFQLHETAAESSNVPQTSIVGPCDRQRPDEPNLACPDSPRSGYCTVMHQNLGEKGKSPRDEAPELDGPMPSSTDSYRDPISIDGERPVEFAAFAEVEATPFRVIVHHPPTRVIRLAREMPRRLVLPVIIALAAWAALFGLSQRRITRRRRKHVMTAVRTPLPVEPSKASTAPNK
jgi:serine/threonine-protein kinase